MIIKLIKEILFPVFCIECGEEGEWWCKQCFENSFISVVLRCPGCGKTNHGETCQVCRSSVFLDGTIALMEYAETKPAGKLIKNFKYKFAHDTRPAWEMIADKCIPKIILPDNGVITPVPLYPRRERERGFNQSDILAGIFFDKIKKYFPERKYEINNKILRRTRATNQQAKLSREERERNVSGAFCVKNKIVPYSVILVDDIFTTGATLNECAKELKQNGVKKVWALTLARTT